MEVTVQQQCRVTERLSLCTDPIGVPHAVRTVDTSGNKKLHFIRMVMKWRNTMQVWNWAGWQAFGWTWSFNKALGKSHSSDGFGVHYEDRQWPIKTCGPENWKIPLLWLFLSTSALVSWHHNFCEWWVAVGIVALLVPSCDLGWCTSGSLIVYLQRPTSDFVISDMTAKPCHLEKCSQKLRSQEEGYRGLSLSLNTKW